MIAVQELDVPDVKLLRPRRHDDSRGFLTEIVNERTLAGLGLISHFVQENQSFSRHKGTIRGLHWQKEPQAQAKLVRVLRGKIYDVAVDIRPASPSFGHFAAAVLTEEDQTQILVPAGFAHGFCTLADETVVNYKMSDFYAPGAEAGIVWNDPDLGIPWPFDPATAILSEKDALLPRWRDIAPSLRTAS